MDSASQLKHEVSCNQEKGPQPPLFFFHEKKPKVLILTLFFLSPTPHI